MEKSIVINKQHLSIRSYKGQKVVTFKDIDLVHGRAEGTARRNFNTNKNHFIEGADYFVRNSSEAKKEFGISAPNGLLLITESGYLMLAKSFTDDLAWSVQRQLVNFYFRSNQSKTAKLPIPEQLTLETKEYYYFDKTFRGQPVLTTKDIEYFTGITVGALNYYLRNGSFVLGEDYFKLENSPLREFKAENFNIKRTIGGPYNIITKSGFIKLMKQSGKTAEMPKCFDKSNRKEIVNYADDIFKMSKNDFIIAINVLRAAIYNAKGSQNEYVDNGQSPNMFNSYQKDIDAYTLTMRRLCSYLGAGCGKDF